MISLGISDILFDPKCNSCNCVNSQTIVGNVVNLFEFKYKTWRFFKLVIASGILRKNIKYRNFYRKFKPFNLIEM